MLRFEVNYTSAHKIEEALLSITTVINGEQNKIILNKVGNLYLADTLKRFENQHDPDRKPWKKLSPVTIKMKSNYRTRSVDAPTRKGVWYGDLINSLSYRIEGNSVLIGSNVKHAKYFHYGAKTYVSLRGEATAPWGNIPPRRFLGRNTRIDDKVLKVIGNELEKIMGFKPNSIKSAV